MRIAAGTYEGFCYGWETALEPGKPSGTVAGDDSNSDSLPLDTTNVDSPDQLSLAFGYNVHVGCLKSVAMATSGTRAGRLLVTGGADERVRIYDMKDRTELGELQQHNGTVTCMEFYRSTHLLTGSEDHAVCIWRVHDWALLHVLGGHKAAVTSLSIHPSGRMALSVSRDRTMRLWNLLEGRCAYVKRLQGEGELVRWSVGGSSYLVVVGTNVVVYSAKQTAEPTGECKHRARVNSACFVGEEEGSEGVALVLATCADDKIIRFFRAVGGKLLSQLDVSDICPTGRVRDMCYVAPSTSETSDAGADADTVRGALVAVTSAGRVNVWGVPSLESVGEGQQEGEMGATVLDVPLLATHTVKGEPRFTCVTACLSDDTLAEDRRQDQQQRSKKNLKKRKQRPLPAEATANPDAPLEKVDNGEAKTSKKHKKKKKGKGKASDLPNGTPPLNGEASSARKDQQANQANGSVSSPRPVGGGGGGVKGKAGRGKGGSGNKKRRK